MSRKRGQLPLTETDREDNDSIPKKAGSPVSDPEPALEALRDAYANLIERLHSPSVIEHLYSGRLLTKVEYDLAKSKESDYDKNTEVLGALMRRGPAEVVKFCQVLFEQNQHNCGRLLLDALNRREVDVSSVVIPSQTPPVVRSTSPKYYIEMEDLDDAFITLVREVKKVGASLDPEDLRTICIQLLNGVSSTKRNVQEDIDALRRCNEDYIGYLQPYWDSLDCNLLHSLIRQLNKPELIGDWEKYRTQVKEACTATLEECRRSLPQGRDLPPNQISVGFQTTQPPNDVTVQKMLDLKDFLIKRMGLEEADFAGFTNSDVTLFFTVSRSRLPFLVRMCALHRRSLQDFSITVVFVPGEFIYDVITDQEFPYPEASSLRSEPVLQIKDLKAEMLRQFEQLQTSKAAHDRRQVVAVFEKVQQELISTKKKLDVVEEGFVEAEKMLRTSTVSWSEDKVDRSLQLSGGGTTECEDELFALAYEDGVKDKYMCHVYEKLESHRPQTIELPYYSTYGPTMMYTTTQLHMVITYSTSHWSQIVQKYYKPVGEDWKLRTVIQDFTVEGDVITPHIPESPGAIWSCAIDGIDQVPMSSLDFTKRFPPDGPKSLEQAVKSSFYPPKINLMASSDVYRLDDYSRSRFIYIAIAGSSPRIRIPVQVVDRVEPGMREQQKVFKLHSDRKAHKKKSFSEEDFLSPSTKTGKQLKPSVQVSRMTEASLWHKATKASSRELVPDIVLPSSEDKDQQAN